MYLSWLPEQFSESQAASCKHSQGCRCRVTESIAKKESNLEEASKTFNFNFSFYKSSKTLKTISAYKGT
jgi:hypothetical protein